MIRIKKGVILTGLSLEMWEVVPLVHVIFYPHWLTITSGLEGKHGDNSLHYVGKALDFRTRHLDDEGKRLVTFRCKEFLADAYDVVLEKTHLHIEYHPKG